MEVEADRRNGNPKKNLMLRVLKKGVKDIPFILLSLDFVWWVLSYYDIWSLENWWVLEITSHSLAFVFFMAFYAYIHKYCLYSWVSIISLGLLNILNIIHYVFNLNYLIMYSGVIIITGLVFALIYWIKKK